MGMIPQTKIIIPHDGGDPFAVSYWVGNELSPAFDWYKHGGIGGAMHPDVAYLDLDLVISNQGFIPDPTNLSDLKQRSLNSMLPGVKSEMSLINSVIELKDFKGLVKGLIKKFPLVKSLINGKTTLGQQAAELIGKIVAAKSAYKRSPSKALKAAIGAASSNYLGWKFAVAPLISDIRAVMRAIRSHEKQLNRLISEEGRPRVKHWSFTWQEYDVYIRSTAYNCQPSTSPTWSYDIGAVVNSTVIPETSVFHAEVEYNYNFTQYQREHARLYGVLDSLGVNLNPAIIWNAIPWSFVVDWVFGVSKYLDQFKVRNMEPTINIRRYLWSIKRRRMTVWSKDYTAPSTRPFTPTVSMPTIFESSYKRQVDGISASSIISSGLNSSEFTLGAALVIATRRRRKRT
jgi:hypothetical protein